MLALACAGQSPSERATEHEKHVRSWTATVHLVAEEWARRAVPDAYARRTLAAIGQELNKEAQSVAKDQLAPSDRVRLLAELARADTLVSRLAGSSGGGPSPSSRP
jgi:hypothetical protein